MEMDKCKHCERSEGNHPLYDGFGYIKCKYFEKEEERKTSEK